MRRNHIAVFWITIVFCCALTACAQSLSPIKGSRVMISVPEGFTATDRFPGLIAQEHSASIMVTELPVPFSELATNFTKESFSRQRMTLLASEDVKFGPADGKLYSLNQSAQGQEFQKWIGVFGEAQSTFMVTATFPKDSPTNLSARLKTAVTSARLNPQLVNPADALTFTITPASDLKIARVIGNNLFLTRAGAFPVKQLEGPIFAAGASVTQGRPIPNTSDFALARLRQTATLTNFIPATPEEILIDQLPGYEITAEATHAETGKKATIYQVVLVNNDAYYLLQGIVATAEKETYLPAFTKIAQSFKRK